MRLLVSVRKYKREVHNIKNVRRVLEEPQKRTIQHKLHIRRIKDVKLIIDSGYDINSKDGYNYSFLYNAIMYNCVDVVKLLISRGANVNVDVFEKPLLHLATIYSCREIAEILLSRGLDINVTDNYNNTALHKVASNGNVEVMEVLLTAGAKINAQNNRGFTPLLIAIYDCEYETKQNESVKLLLSWGADMSLKTDTNMTPIIAAITKNNPDVVKLLISHGVLNIPDDNTTAIHFATAIGAKSIVELLIDAGVDVNSRDKFNNTPLHVATINNQKAIVQLLLERRADKTIENDEDETAYDLTYNSEIRMLLRF